jgi:hypothetical protein
MRLNEFINKQKNVLSASSSRRVDKSIPITEERERFFSDEVFRKYDIVKNENQILRVLEKGTNYYFCVDESGNVVRKFERQLTLVESGNRNFADLATLTLHGYKPSQQLLDSDLAPVFRKSINTLLESTLNDDIAVLKELKEADRQIQESMDTTYQAKDKITIAKIIADACGVKHDVISSPENLVAKSIMAAKKNPALMRNKEILQNMLNVAREAGIKFNDATFAPMQESFKINDDDYYVFHKPSKKIVKNLGKKHVPMFQNPDVILKDYLPDSNHTIMRGLKLKSSTVYEDVSETNEDLRSFVRTKTLGLIRANIQKSNHDDFAKQHDKMSVDAYKNGNTKSGDAHKAAAGRHSRASKRTNDAYEKHEAGK